MTIIRGARLPEATAPSGLSPLVDIHIVAADIVSIVPTTASPRADTIIDAGGRLALPGFIDAHVHGEAAVFSPEIQRAMLRQGITSIITGQDGVSFAPTASAGTMDFHTFDWATNYFCAINGKHPTFRGGSVADLLATFDHTTAINTAFLVPHGTVRYSVMGDDPRAATSTEIEQMATIVATGLREGACGFSTGLEYVPGTYANQAELLALTQIAANFGVPHVSHMRGYEDRAGTAIAELKAIAHATSVATHISHYHGPGTELAHYIDQALEEGLDVTFDSYPYLRGCSILSMVSLPLWLPLAHPQRTVAALRDPAIAQRLHTEHFPHLLDLWPRITMAAVPGEMAWSEGMTLCTIAARQGQTPAETVIDLLITTELQAGCIFSQPPTNSPESVRTLLQHPAHMGGSDAIYAGGHPHPRGWGTFARFLAQYVRTGEWTWAQAQEHLSSAAAQRFNLHRRGTLQPGNIADIILIDPDTVRDNATFHMPRQLATGIDDVLTSGIQVLRDGDLTGATPGHALRPYSYTTS